MDKEIYDPRLYLAHYGSPLAFIRMAWRNRPIPPDKFSKLASFLIRSCLIFPGSLLERLTLSRAIWSTQVQNPPLFILGHYRSGTTLLHKLMASSQAFAFIDGLDAIFPYSSLRIKKWLKPVVTRLFLFLKVRNYAFHDYFFQLDDPVEEEAYLLYINSPFSAFWGIVFPRQWRQNLHRYITFENQSDREKWQSSLLFLVKKMTWRYGNTKPLVLKSPPSTGRVSALLELFPSARFIYLHRNPYHVFSSMQAMSKNNIEVSYALQATTPTSRQEVIFNHYRVLMDQFEKEKHLIPSGHLLEFAYEELVSQRLDVVKQIFDTWYPETDQSKVLPGIEKLISKEQSYHPLQHVLGQETIQAIEQQWGKYIQKWNYHP